MSVKVPKHVLTKFYNTVLPEDVEDVLADIPREFHEDIIQGYWNDWVEQAEEAKIQRLEARVKKLEEELRTVIESSEPRSTGEEGWMSTEQVAEYLGTCTKSIRRAVERGNLTAHKFPPGSKKGRWRFKRDDIEREMRKKRAEGRPRKGASVWS